MDVHVDDFLLISLLEQRKKSRGDIMHGIDIHLHRPLKIIHLGNTISGPRHDSYVVDKDIETLTTTKMLGDFEDGSGNAVFVLGIEFDEGHSAGKF